MAKDYGMALNKIVDRASVSCSEYATLCNMVTGYADTPAGPVPLPKDIVEEKMIEKADMEAKIEKVANILEIEIPDKKEK